MWLIRSKSVLTGVEDISKIIVGSAAGALGGFIVGVLTEPIRIWFRNANDRTRLRNLVYRDLALIYEDMIWLKYLAASGKGFSDANLETASGRYDAAQRDQVLYCELPESVSVDILHERLMALAAQPQGNMSRREEKLDEMIAAFESAILHGSFKVRRLRKFRTKTLSTGLEAIRRQYLKVSAQ